MPPTYAVRASVIDLRTDSPRPKDRLLVDTNVWALKHYPGAAVSSGGVPTVQHAEYVPYFDRTIAAGAIRYRVVASLMELASLIDSKEPDFYVAGVGPKTLKEYRHNLPSERARVVAEIQRVWRKIEAHSEPLPLTLDDALARAASARLSADLVDGYDLALLEAMASAGVTQLLTDDGDFCTVAGIEVFTANPRVLAAARNQGRLVVR